MTCVGTYSVINRNIVEILLMNSQYISFSLRRQEVRPPDTPQLFGGAGDGVAGGRGANGG